MENITKKKRGRPPIVQDKASWGALWGELGQRALTNKWYKMRALKALEAFPELLAAMNVHGRHSIFDEIGRLPSKELIIEAAKWVVENKPTARIAIRRIRNMRLTVTGKVQDKQGDEWTLRTELRRCLNEYTDRYPDTSKATCLEATRALYFEVEELMEAT